MDSDGEEVVYEVDDNPLPKGASYTATGPLEGDAEPEGGDERESGGTEESGARPQGEEAES